MPKRPTIVRTGEPNRIMIELDDETFARLITVAEEAHAPMQVVAASIVHDVLMDDALAHADADSSGPTKVPDYLH